MRSTLSGVRPRVVDGSRRRCSTDESGCVIRYYTLGTVRSMVDRGRVLGQLDDELLGICQPPNTEKYDYTQSPGVDLGTSVFWNQPAFQEATTDRSGGRAHV